MAHQHASLIEQLGGHIAVAKALSVAPNVVWNWLQRGVSWPYRAEVARLARRRRVAVPEAFTAPSAPAKRSAAA